MEYRGMGSGVIWLDEVECTTNDSYLAQCDHNGWGLHDCTHAEDVGITCGESGYCHQRLCGHWVVAIYHVETDLEFVMKYQLKGLRSG